MMMQGYDWEENAGWMMDDACFGVKMLAAQLNAGAPVHGKPWRGLSPASAWWSGLVWSGLFGWTGHRRMARRRRLGRGPPLLRAPSWHVCSDSLLAHRAARFGAAACGVGYANHSPFTNASSIWIWNAAAAGLGALAEGNASFFLNGLCVKQTTHL